MTPSYTGAYRRIAQDRIRLAAADGRNSVIDVPGSPPIRGQLEADSLFYSYRADDPAYPGRVVYTPFDT